MRKQIRKADTTSRNFWLPGFEPDSAPHTSENRPSFDVVLAVTPSKANSPATIIEVAHPTPIQAAVQLVVASHGRVSASADDDTTAPGICQAVSNHAANEPGPNGLGAQAVQFSPAQREWTSENFEFTTDFAFASGIIERFHANLEAIQLARQLTTAGTRPTHDQQVVLARYSGWGGMSALFGGKSEPWARRQAELESILSVDEYEAARSSVLNAHYTDPIVVRALYTALEAMGFEGGRVLDPSTGIGHFIGSMPRNVAERSSITAIEIDPLSASIASLLYPDALIRNTGLESANLPDSHFDLVISNAPFGNYTVFDPAFRGRNCLIHDYFMLKAASLVRPGGLIAMITSTGTMDKVAKDVRTRLRSTCDLVGAIRLPTSTFEALASTSVTSDVVFLRRRLPGETGNGIDWMQTGHILDQNHKPMSVNEYFVRNPDMVIGKMVTDTRGSRTVTNAVFSGCLSSALNQTLSKLPAGLYRPLQNGGARTAVAPEQQVRLNVALKANSFVVVDSVVCRVGADGLSATPASGLTSKASTRVAGMVRVRDAMKEVLRTQVTEASDGEISNAIASLNRRYDEFVRVHGILHDRQNRRAFKGDPDLPALLALEDFDDEAGTATKMPIFLRRTIMPMKAPASVDTPQDALLVSLNWHGAVVPDFICGLLPGRKWDGISNELMEKGLAWLNPETQLWEPREVYLAGNVRKKLRAARLAALTDRYFDAHIKALEAIVPVDLVPSEITANLGAAWIPDDVVTEFVGDILNTPHINLRHSLASASWKVEFNYAATHLTRSSVQNTATWGTSRVTGMELLNDALNQVTTTVYDMVEDRSFINERETMLAREKLADIRSHFREWIWSDQVRADRLARIYNDEFNSVVLPIYDGSHLTFPGMSDAIKPRDYQANAVWRYLCGGNLLLAHCVGAGKTAEAIIANMEARRVGIFKKPLFVVPNHMLEDYAAEFLRIYPAANLLCASKEDLAGDRRRELLARIATGDWDGIIITQASFEKLALSPEHLDGFISDELSRLDEAIEDAWADGDRAIAKRLEGVRKSVIAKLERLSDSTSKDNHIYFNELGIDALVYDEAQAIKNLFFATKISRVAGLPNAVSRRALDAYAKIQYIQSKHGGDRGVMFTTATPIANSMAEMFTVQRYLSRKLLREHDLDSFDAWAATFGRIVSSMEVSPDGGGFRMNNRFAQFVNLPELMQMFGAIADVKTREEISLPVPDVVGGKAEVVIAKPSPALRECVVSLVQRAESIRQGRVKPHEDNMLAVTGDGRRAALDLRLHDPFAEDYAGSKVNLAVDQVFGIWESTQAKRSTQLVFCDLSTPKNHGFSVYNDMKAKWIQKGIPAEEIAFIHDYDTDEKKASLFRRVRKGIVRILMGSTAKMGVGTNVQRLLYAIHHLDAPWRPDEVEQRDGRGIRPGNSNKEIRIFRYVTESTFDAYMWQLLESKATFIAQVMSPGCKVRSAEDVVVAALTYAEVKAIATGNPLFLKKAEIESSIARISLKKRDFEMARDRARRELSQADKRMAAARKELTDVEADDELREVVNSQAFAMQLNGKSFEDTKLADQVLRQVMTNAASSVWKEVATVKIGTIGPFDLVVLGSPWKAPVLEVRGALAYEVNDTQSLSIAVRNSVKRIKEHRAAIAQRVEQLDERFAALSVEANGVFAEQEALNLLYGQQDEIYGLLGLTSDQAYGAGTDSKPELEVVVE